MVRGKGRQPGRRDGGTAWLWAAALAVLALGVILMVVAVNRQPPLVQRPEVLPAPTVVVPTMPAALPSGGQLPPGASAAFPRDPAQSGIVPGTQPIPGGIPGALAEGGVPAGMPVGMPPAGAMPPAAHLPAATPAPTATPPIAETFACGQKLTFKVKPEDAVVTINGEVIGRARRFAEEELELPEAGVYYVRISAPGYTEYWCKVVARADADKKTKTLEIKLAKERD